jgi:fatty-acid desaturase
MSIIIVIIVIVVTIIIIIVITIIFHCIISHQKKTPRVRSGTFVLASR